METNKRFKLIGDLMSQVQTLSNEVIIETNGFHTEEKAESDKQANHQLTREVNRLRTANMTHLIIEDAERALDLKTKLMHLKLRHGEALVRFRETSYGKLIETGMEILKPLYEDDVKKVFNQDLIVSFQKAGLRGSKKRPLKEMLFNFDSKVDFTLPSGDAELKPRHTRAGETIEAKCGLIQVNFAMTDLPEIKKQVDFCKDDTLVTTTTIDIMSLKVKYMEGLSGPAQCVGCHHDFQVEELRSYGMIKDTGFTCTEHPLHICCAALATLKDRIPLPDQEYTCPICPK